MDVIELNEAFAAQALAVTRDHRSARRRRARESERRRDRARPSARRERRAPRHDGALSAARTGGRYALCTMCIGVGQGIAHDHRARLTAAFFQAHLRQPHVSDSLFATDAMRDVFSDRARIARMLDFEAALAQAEASVGVIPRTAADAIARGMHDRRIRHRGDLARRRARRSNLAIPLVAALTPQGRSGGTGGERLRALGRDEPGMSSIPGLVLQLRDALALIEADVDRLAAVLADQTRRHAATVLAGRTWLQQALPVTLGVKLAGRSGCASSTPVAARNGAPASARRPVRRRSGTLASLGDRGIAVTEALAANLALDVPTCRGTRSATGSATSPRSLGMLTATLGKFARDVALLAQSEVGEAQEPALPGRGGSSTMPQKRNPVGAAIALEAAVRVPGLVSTMLTAAVQEHEARSRQLARRVGDAAATSRSARLARSSRWSRWSKALTSMRTGCGANLEITQGLIFAEAVQMALAPKMGRDTAHSLVAGACRRAECRARAFARDSRAGAEGDAGPRCAGALRNCSTPSDISARRTRSSSACWPGTRRPPTRAVNRR